MKMFAKRTCESSHGLSIYWLRKHGYLRGGRRSGGIKWTSGWGAESSIGFSVDISEVAHVDFWYSRTGPDDKKEDMNYRVQLSSTPCQFGGKRYWFICPLVTEGKPCHRRVGVLYLAGKYMGCRDCYGLAYRSQQESSKYRAIGKFLSFSNEIDEKEKELRTRYWKGKPTKRYDRLIRKMEAMNGIARTVIDDMDKRNSQPEKRSINRGKRV